MSESCTHDCSTCSSKCAEADLREAPHEMSHIKKVIGIVSGKGGVGKSLVTSLLAVLSNRNGFRTAVLDADVTGPSIPRIFGLKEKAGASDIGIFPVNTKTGIAVMSLNLLLENETDPVVWRGPVIAGVVKQFWTDVVWGDVDYLFVDMPPGTGDVTLTAFQSLPLDGILIVTSPQELVGMIVEKAVNMANLMNIPVLGLVENLSYAVCPDCGREIPVFGESRLAETAAKFGVANTARIPINPKLAAACDAGAIELFEGSWLDELFNRLQELD